MKWQRWQLSIAACVLAMAGIVGCEKCGGAASATGDAGKSDVALPAAPQDLLADVVLTTPNGSWRKFQSGIGGAAGLLPTTLPGLLITQTDLDMNLAAECDGSSPIYGVVAGAVGDPGIAVAVKLLDARRTKSLLTGEGARFVAKEGAGITLLDAAKPGARRFELAITDNGFLVVTKRSADRAVLGPYVTRTLPARPVPQESIVVEMPRAALQGAIKPWLDGVWNDAKAFLVAQDQQMRAAKGRAPDFGDPAAIIATLDGALSQRFAVIGDLDKVRAAIDVLDDAVVGTATLTPSKEEGAAKRWLAGMQVGDPAPVLALSATSGLALSMRDGEPARAEQLAEVEKGLVASLGARLGDPAKLHDLFDTVTKARDEATAVAVGSDDPPGIVLRAPVRDAEAAERAIRGAGDLAKADPFKEILRLREVVAGAEDVPGIGKTAILTFVRGEAKTKGRASGKPPAVAWSIADRVLTLAGGPEPLVTLKLGAKPDRKLGDEPSLKRFLGTIGSDASTVIVAQPLRFDVKSANLPMAPIGIAIGKKSGSGMIRVDVSNGLLHELARRELGF